MSAERVRELATRMARANPKWSRPRGAHLQCEEASFRFGCVLEERAEIRSTLITSEAPPHVAVLAAGLVVDLTARQFDPEAPYPLVTTPEQWRTWISAVSTPAS